MATISRRANKSGTYYYLVESARVNGKPRLVKQIYLGTAEKIAQAVKLMSSGAAVPDPRLVTVYDFGAVTALYSVADRLGLCQIIDNIAGKRNQGLPVSASILLAAINRAVAPTSKNTFFEWFDKTVLYKMFPKANAKNLSSQGFWNNMSVLDEERIRKIEDEVTKKVVKQYEIDLECLLFDNTNFFTYLDTANPSKLAQRGHCKQKRTDLKIVGLSLMVSPDHNIPLFHEVYPGNTHDAQQFSNVISKLKNRYQKLGKGECTVTLVFDKGNNNEANIQELINLNPCPFHFVGGLRLSQCQGLLDIPKADFIKLDGTFHNATAYRTLKQLYEREFTVVVTYNPELYKAQMDGVLNNIASCQKALAALQEKLRLRKEGIITKGRKPTAASVIKNVKSILSAEYMRDIFDYTVTSDSGQPLELTFSLNDEHLSVLQERSLGKSILFTDHHDWPNEQIVSAYRSQYHVEEAFKQMKDTKYLSFRPVRHFSDAHIRVHAFYCVLAFMLSSLLNKELEQMGHKISIHHMLDKFQDAQQVVSIFASPSGKPMAKTSYSRFKGVTKEYAEKYDLLKYLD
jgi:transposase